MLFPTFTFAFFFAIVLPIGWRLNDRPRAWKLFMLGASYMFYGWIEPWWVFLLLGSTVVNQLLAEANTRAVDDRMRRITVSVAVAANLGLLGLFKYFDFFTTSVSDALDAVGFSTSPTLLHLALPVGISFFTFQAMSYVIDVHRGDLQVGKPIDFAVYLAFFPQLVAGPIVRATEFLPQLKARRNPAAIDLTGGLILIGSGLFKKVVISSFMSAAIADDVFAFPERFSALEIIVGVYAYAVQIYADFSGYTDIAIGVALLMGFRLPQNFNRPYSAASIQDFWRRWHMTLSRWLRDYLYISLGGNRHGLSKTRRNLFLTMLLGGLWHGAAWTFVIWGALHGLGLGLERYWREDRPVADLLPAQPADLSTLATGRTGVPTARAPVDRVRMGATRVAERLARPAADLSRPAPVGGDLLHQVATFHFVCLGWVFFRADSVSTAFTVLWRALTAWGTDVGALSWLLVFTIAASVVAQYLPRTPLAALGSALSRLPVWAQATGFAVWLLVIDLLGPEGVAPFIYFQF